MTTETTMKMTYEEQLLNLAAAVLEGNQEKANDLAAGAVADKYQQQKEAERREKEAAEAHANAERVNGLREVFYAEHVTPLAKRLQAHSTHLSTHQVAVALATTFDGVSVSKSTAKRRQFEQVAEVLLGLGPWSATMALRDREYKDPPSPDEKRFEALALVLRSAKGGTRRLPRFGVQPEDLPVLQQQLIDLEVRLDELEAELADLQDDVPYDERDWATITPLQNENQQLLYIRNRLVPAVMHLESEAKAA